MHIERVHSKRMHRECVYSERVRHECMCKESVRSERECSAESAHSGFSAHGPPKKARALNRGKNQGMIDDHVTERIDRGEEYFGACLKRRGNQNDIVLPHLYENESA